MVTEGEKNRQSVFNWLNTSLRNLNLQFSRSGFKGGSDIGKHVVDETTGFWGNPQYSRNKPPRWIVHVDARNAQTTARLPESLQEIGIGGSNTAQGDKAGLAVRVLPLIQTGATAFKRADDFEANVLFLFHGALRAGSSSDAFAFSPATGALTRSVEGTTKAEGYIFAAMLGLRPRADAMTLQVNGAARSVSYGEAVDAIRAATKVHPAGGALVDIPLYDLSQEAEADRLKADIQAAWDAAGPPPEADDGDDADGEGATETIDFTALAVPENPDLMGIDPSVYRQINAALRSGKQHIMLYGPPGTGKTSLARWIASSLPGGQWTLVTGSSDWSSQDIIGGYQPIGNGDVDFVPGILLRDFDRPLIIDEMNRCDIDKVIGPLFTVLSGHQTTLPYRTDLADKDSTPYAILPIPKPNAAPHEFAPGKAWRLIATINSIDKASLYQMSYALSRRFGWVYVDAPQDLAGFIAEYLASKGVAIGNAGAVYPLAELWKAINGARVIGPAPIIDAINAIREIAPQSSFVGAADEAMREAALDAIDMVLLPMLDGIVLQDAMSIADAAIAAFGLTAAAAARVRRRLESVAI